MLRGTSHREGKPSFLGADGTTEYRERRTLHRLDGPAVIYPDGREQYWWYGQRTTSIDGVRGYELDHQERLTAEERHWQAVEEAEAEEEEARE